MTESRDEMVVRMAAAFPWAEYNRENPITPGLVRFKFCIELCGGDDVLADKIADSVVKLVNERPADPFEGIA